MRTGSTARRARGFTYGLLLFAIAVGGIGLAALGEQARLRMQREREVELRFRGAELARAIASYVQAGPADSRALPARVEDLLDDRRSGRSVRHLRRLYVDPLAPPHAASWPNGGWDWLPLGVSGCDDVPGLPVGIAAVRSRSKTPLLAGGLEGRLACDLVFRHDAHLHHFLNLPAGTSRKSPDE